MSKKILAWIGSALGSAGLVLLAPIAAHAQQQASSAAESPVGGLEEIVVTAQRRSEAAVDVPISITALSQAQLDTANVQNLGDIMKVTPGLRFDYQTGFAQPTIRGIGTGITTSGGGSNVGVYIDGFYSPNPLASDFQLLEVSSIQVLKGPQGTLFGHNATGGAIVVTTDDPSVEPRAEAKVSYGRFASQKYQAYATGGYGIAAADVEGVYSKGSGFITNIVDDDSHVAAYENWTVRTGLKLQFTDWISVLFRYTHSDQDDPSTQMLNSNTDTSINPSTGQPWGIQTYTVPGTYTTNPNQIAQLTTDPPRLYTNSTNIETATVKADLGFANLTSYSQYRQEDVNQSEALQQVALPIFQLGLPIFDYTTSQEFLLTSKPGPRLQWTAGAYYLSYRDTYVTYVDSAPTPTRFRLGGSSTTTQNIAGYADATYEITPKLFFTGGVRYAHDAVIDAYYNPSPFVGANPNQEIKVPSINSTKATPRAVLRYKLTDDSNVYASYTEGYKAAILDVGGSCQDFFDNYKCNNVQPEDVHAYEIGYKYDDHRIANSLSAFLYNYKNLQVSEFLAQAEAYIVNAAQSRIYGLDDDFHWNLNEHFQVVAGFAWTHARYLQFGGSTNSQGQVVGAPIYATCPAPAAFASDCSPGTYAYVNTGTILHNVHMQHSPDNTANIGPRFSTGQTAIGEFALSSNLYYTSRIYYSPSGTQFQQPAYATLDVRGQWNPTKNYYVAVWGDNVANSRYRNQVQYNGFGIGAGWSAPAIWGVEFGAKF